MGINAGMSRMTDLPERIAQAVAERVVALVVDALDINAVLERVDVDALLERVDVEALVARIDVDGLLERVDVARLVTRINVASTMANTATTAADDTVAALRRTAQRGDTVTGSWAGRLIGRT